MPTYEYNCDKCGHSFELVQPMSAEPLKTCPKDKCGMKRWGKGKVKRAIGTGAGLIFKGSGFYITDYRSEGYKEAAKKDSGTPAAPAKTDAAPASTPAAAPAAAPAKPAEPAPKPAKSSNTSSKSATKKA
jgi:putative FmdB family regulatory protein